MKTDLTKHIQHLLKAYYHPNVLAGQRLNKHRPTFIVTECVVSTGTTKDGIVDVMRLDETLKNEERKRICYQGFHKEKFIARNLEDYVFSNGCGKSVVECPKYCDNIDCKRNSYEITYDNDILISCFEIKVSKSDFHSSNGHNFVGNANYYVMPFSLYKELKDEIPNEIGVIAYISTDKFDGLRKVKDCIYQDTSNETKMWQILNILKRYSKEINIYNGGNKDDFLF